MPLRLRPKVLSVGVRMGAASPPTPVAVIAAVLAPVRKAPLPVPAHREPPTVLVPRVTAPLPRA